MNRPRFRLRTLMLVVAGAGLLFGLCRGMVGLFGSAGALTLVLMYLVCVSTMFLIAVLPVLFCELIVYVIEQVLRRRKGDSTGAAVRRDGDPSNRLQADVGPQEISHSN